MSDLPVIVARIARAHGIRGGLLLDSETDYPEALFQAGRRLQVVSGVAGTPPTLEITAARPHSGRWLVSVAEVTDRETAGRLRGIELGVPRDELPEFGEDSYLLRDLIGLELVEAGEAIGPIGEVYDLPAGPMLSVQVAGRERLVPFQTEFVRSVDFETRTVEVVLPEGLLDL